MESRIKEQQLDLFADRTSTHWMASNQLRLWFSAFAHFLISTLRAWVLRGTELEQPPSARSGCDFLKLPLGLKSASGGSTSNFARPYPLKGLFAQIHHRLTALPIGPPPD
jgi:hypothetical protein